MKHDEWNKGSVSSLRLLLGETTTYITKENKSGAQNYQAGKWCFWINVHLKTKLQTLEGQGQQEGNAEIRSQQMIELLIKKPGWQNHIQD